MNNEKVDSHTHIRHVAFLFGSVEYQNTEQECNSRIILFSLLFKGIKPHRRLIKIGRKEHQETTYPSNALIASEPKKK